MIGPSIGIGLTRVIGQGGANPITGTGPTLAALTDGDTLSSAVTWGSYLPAGATADRQMRVDGGAWVAYVGGTVVAEGEVWEASEVVSYGAWASTFVSAAQTVAEAPAAPIVTGEDYDPDTDTLTFAVNEPVTLYALHNASATPLSAATIKAGAEITQALIAGVSYIDWADEGWNGGTWYLHVMVEDADGLTTVLTPIQHIVPIRSFTETWSGFAVGDTNTQIIAGGYQVSGANPPAMTIVANANSPSGKALRFNGSTSSTRKAWRTDIADALAAQIGAGTLSEVELLSKWEMMGANGWRGAFGREITANDLVSGLRLDMATGAFIARYMVSTNPNNSTGTALEGGMPAGGRRWCRLSFYDTNKLRAKWWTDGAAEPAEWRTDLVSPANWSTVLSQIDIVTRVTTVGGPALLGYSVGINTPASAF